MYSRFVCFNRFLWVGEGGSIIVAPGRQESIIYGRAPAKPASGTRGPAEENVRIIAFRTETRFLLHPVPTFDDLDPPLCRVGKRVTLKKYSQRRWIVCTGTRENAFLFIIVCLLCAPYSQEAAQPSAVIRYDIFSLIRLFVNITVDTVLALFRVEKSNFLLNTKP